MRLFLAINPPAGVRRAIWNATSSLREAAPDVSWVDESKIHLTLKFLGDGLDGMAEPLSMAVLRAADNHRALTVHVEGVGAFPNLRRPRVVWIGVTPEPRLELLHHDVEVALDGLGIPIEGRPFRPHLTLARTKEGLTAEQLRGLRSAARKVRFADDFTASSIELMRSDSGPTGQVYTAVATLPLRSSAV